MGTLKARRDRRISPILCISNAHKETEKKRTHLVSRYGPAALGHELGGLLVDGWLGGGNLVLKVQLISTEQWYTAPQ